MNPNYGVIIVVVVIVEIMQEDAPEKLISEVKKTGMFWEYSIFCKTNVGIYFKYEKFFAKNRVN